MTVEPEKLEVNNYIRDIEQNVLDETSELWLIGKMTENIDSKNKFKDVSIFNSIHQLSEQL